MLIKIIGMLLVRRRSRKRRSSGDDDKFKALLNCKVRICSENNFPTAAGLASSAAGYACLGVCVCVYVSRCILVCLRVCMCRFLGVCFCL